MKTNEMNKARDDAGAAAQTKINLADLAHELRTPLNAIIGYAQVLSHTCATCATGQRGIEAILRNGERLSDLLNRALTSGKTDGAETLSGTTAFDSTLLKVETPRRMLIVDDDGDNRKMLSALMRGTGFETTLAASGQDALAALEQSAPFDVVLMDQCMPGMDGAETIRQIRERPDTSNVPILLVTGQSVSDEASAASAVNANGCVFKPLRRAQLLQEIQRIIGIRFTGETASSHAGVSQGHPPAKPTYRHAAASLPTSLTSEIERAVRSGDIAALRGALNAVGNHTPVLAEHLRLLIANYNYDELLRLFEPDQGDDV